MRIAVNVRSGYSYGEDYETLQKKLKEQFAFVEPIKVKHDWNFECFAPRAGTIQEAFDALQKRYSEVGWVNDPE